LETLGDAGESNRLVGKKPSQPGYEEDAVGTQQSKVGEGETIQACQVNSSKSDEVLGWFLTGESRLQS
jgi:hypothetical protein